MKLTAAKVRTLTQPGMHGDGAGLYLNIKATGAKSWVLRTSIDGRRREIGLGGFPTISLAKARDRAASHRLAISEGRDPVMEKRRDAVPTFSQAAETVHALNRPRWRSQKHTDDWWATLARHAMPKLGRVPVDRIDQRDVLAVLTPIWTAKPETARRVRQRIRTVMKWALAHRYVEYNPAGECIDGALPAMPKVKAHLRALPYSEVPAALEIVQHSAASRAAKACFRFAVLTAARSGQARGATWNEINADAREWRIPADRMKSHREHRVPLSDPALAVLEAVRSLSGGDGLVFPSPMRPGRPMSDMTLTKLLRDNDLAGRTTMHGFRSAFRDWASEQTSAPHAVMELALAHNVGSAVERAYARSDLLAKRRHLLASWGQFVTAEPASVLKLDEHVRRKTA